MRALPAVPYGRLAPILGLLAGAAVGMLAVALVSAAVAQRRPSAHQAVLEATHLPPLLALPNEQIDLTYDVHCASATEEDPEQGCRVAGSVFVRADGSETFRPLPLTARVEDGLRQLSVVVPDGVASGLDGFEYYAALEAADGRTLTVPPAGAEAPHRVLRLYDSVEVDLESHAFGSTRSPSARLAYARWGDGPAAVGLEQSPDRTAIGASSFDVDHKGNVVILDHAHRRLLHWQRGAAVPARIPVSIDGRIADMAIARDGSIYVLESVAHAGRNPLIRRFDADGRELDVVEAADPTPSQIRIGPVGPVVLQQPSNQWMPVAVEGSPIGPQGQHRAARNGRPLPGGAEVVVLRRGTEIRVALLLNGTVRRSWLISSRTALAEVQLAESRGQHVVLVVRAYSDASDEFGVLLLDSRGLARQFSLASADWAEGAPLGRFRLVDQSLFRLGSDVTGAFVDRFDLEVR